MNLIIAFLLFMHGLVHMMLAYHPSRDEAAVVGGLWNTSWLFGSGMTTKRLIWIGSIITTILYLVTALSLLGWIVPQEWWRTMMITSTGSSLVVLVVFWFTEFWPGVLIDAVLLLLVLVINWNPIGTVV